MATTRYPRGHDFDLDELVHEPTGFPGELRFVHKRIFGGVASIVGGSAAGRFVQGFLGQGGGPTAADPRPCLSGFRRSSGGNCLRDRSGASGEIGGKQVGGKIGGKQVGGMAAVTTLGGPPEFDDGAGPAVMGRYGVGLMPMPITRQTRVCLPGMVLGDDGVCYESRGFTNKRRAWPKGRAPLLTGGEMNAITIAARAARRVQATTKKLQKLGMLEKPRPRHRAIARAPARLALPATTSIINVE